MEIETKERIIERRKEIERELSEYLVAHKSEYDLEDIQELIRSAQAMLNPPLTPACNRFLPLIPSGPWPASSSP